MAPVRSWSVALLGVTGHLVEIEADIGGGLPGFHLVGLPDAALHEAKDRVRAALVNSGRTWPNERIVLALSPASLRKAGSGFDLFLACAFWFESCRRASGQAWKRCPMIRGQCAQALCSMQAPRRRRCRPIPATKTSTPLWACTRDCGRSQCRPRLRVDGLIAEAM
jgi:hypothetical protein